MLETELESRKDIRMCLGSHCAVHLVRVWCGNCRNFMMDNMARVFGTEVCDILYNPDSTLLPARSGRRYPDFPPLVMKIVRRLSRWNEAIAYDYDSSDFVNWTEGDLWDSVYEALVSLVQPMKAGGLDLAPPPCLWPQLAATISTVITTTDVPNPAERAGEESIVLTEVLRQYDFICPVVCGRVYRYWRASFASFSSPAPLVSLTNMLCRIDELISGRAVHFNVPALLGATEAQRVLSDNRLLDMSESLTSSVEATLEAVPIMRRFLEATSTAGLTLNHAAALSLFWNVCDQSSRGLLTSYMSRQHTTDPSIAGELRVWALIEAVGFAELERRGTSIMDTRWLHGLLPCCATFMPLWLIANGVSTSLGSQAAEAAVMKIRRTTNPFTDRKSVV